MSLPTRQLFILDEHLLKAIEIEDVWKTFEDMKKLDLARPPFPEFDVQVPEASVISTVNTKTGEILKADSGPGSTSWHKSIIFEYTVHPDGRVSAGWTVPNAKGQRGDITSIVHKGYLHSNDGPTYTPQDTIDAVLAILLVTLATRNIEKSVKEHKLARLGIGKGKYSHTTTITIGRVEYDPALRATGLGHSKIPHWRRGHIKSQHYGPKNQLVKQVWIEPVFVNADEEYVAKPRDHYNIVKGAKP